MRLTSLFLLLSLVSPVMAEYHPDLLGHSIAKDKIKNPSPERFSVCFQHTCAMVEHVSLSEAEWLKVGDFFTPEATSAAEERRQIAEAIAWLEIAVGSKIDALDDRGGNLEGFSASGNQLDCVDESTNSTTYLTMMEKAGFLKFHRVDGLATRGGLLFGDRHGRARHQGQVQPAGGRAAPGGGGGGGREQDRGHPAVPGPPDGRAERVVALHQPVRA